MVAVAVVTASFGVPDGNTISADAFSVGWKDLAKGLDESSAEGISIGDVPVLIAFSNMSLSFGSVNDNSKSASDRLESVVVVVDVVSAGDPVCCRSLIACDGVVS